MFVSFNLVFLSAAIQAEEARTNLDAHVHGVSELMVVAEEIGRASCRERV